MTLLMVLTILRVIIEMTTMKRKMLQGTGLMTLTLMTGMQG